VSTGYEAWLCDLDGTLYRPVPLKLLMGAELLLLGLADLRAIRVFRREHERLRGSEQFAPGTVPFELQLQRAAEQLGLGPEVLRAKVERWMIERPARWVRVFRRKALLQEIRDYRHQGGKTAVVSDYPARSKLRAMGLDDLFEVVVANGEPGGPLALKPRPDGYLLAARRLGVEPARCLVIGDRDDADGAAARAAGMAFRNVAMQACRSVPLL
jgi:HAD superfamily hydrolase (TIGR01549 family)